MFGKCVLCHEVLDMNDAKTHAPICPELNFPDPVSSPEHYRWLPVETIEITEHFSFTLGNVLKYVMRADHKGKPLEDLKKARWYLDREIARRESSDDTPTPTR